ncbi:MAG: hypothetical protein JW969_12200 [Spirochaetales bacterium]|nr:hypothetical protein [Spirochaetales bacterium]
MWDVTYSFVINNSYYNREWKLDTYKKLDANSYVYNMEVITTTSDSSCSDTNDPVYIQLSSVNSKVRLDSTYDDFVKGETDYFSGLGGYGILKDSYFAQISKTGSDGVRFNTIIVLMNSQIVYFKYQYSGIWIDETSNRWYEYGIQNQTEWKDVIY